MALVQVIAKRMEILLEKMATCWAEDCLQ